MKTLVCAVLAACCLSAQDLPKDLDVGIYMKESSSWIEAPVEIVYWKTGGVVKSLLTDFIVKGDLNGRIRGDGSTLVFSGPTKIEAVIRTLEGTSAEEYQLIKLRPHFAAREFRSVTGGVFHVSGGPERDLVPFKATRVASRTWSVMLNNLPEGDYGFIPPVNTASIAGSGKIYTFKIRKCERCEEVRRSKLSMVFGKDPAMNF